MRLKVASKFSLALCMWSCFTLSLAFAQHTPREVKTEHVHNVWQLSERILSGSEPEDAAALVELSLLGVKTIVSVDGIAPQVALAKKFGLRYVHIPIGYDGIASEARDMLTRVARDVPGTIYIHCHHGKHRGPAAAAILCRADDGRAAATARIILEKAGTGKEYAGLWRDVELYEAPPLSARLLPLVERAEVESLAAAMAKLDRTFDRLNRSSANGWQSARNEPEFSAYRESVQLKELFAESARATGAGDVQTRLEASSTLAQELADMLRASPLDRPRCNALLTQLGSGCASCHKQHRN